MDLLIVHVVALLLAGAAQRWSHNEPTSGMRAWIRDLSARLVSLTLVLFVLRGASFAYATLFPYRP